MTSINCPRCRTELKLPAALTDQLRRRIVERVRGTSSDPLRSRADSDEQHEPPELDSEPEQGIASTTCDPKSTGAEDAVVRLLNAALHEWILDRDAGALRSKLEAALMLLARSV